MAVLRARPRDMDLCRTKRIWSNCWNQSDVLNQVQMHHLRHNVADSCYCWGVLILLYNPNAVVVRSIAQGTALTHIKTITLFALLRECD